MTLTEPPRRYRAGRLAVIAAAALLAAAPATADPGTDDVTFLATLSSAGLSYSGGSAAVIDTAKAVCTLIGQGRPAPEVLAMLQERNPGLSVDHGTKFLAIAVRSYCPERAAG